MLIYEHHQPARQSSSGMAGSPGKNQGTYGKREAKKFTIKSIPRLVGLGKSKR